MIFLLTTDQKHLPEIPSPDLRHINQLINHDGNHFINFPLIFVNLNFFLKTPQNQFELKTIHKLKPHAFSLYVKVFPPNFLPIHSKTYKINFFFFFY